MSIYRILAVFAALLLALARAHLHLTLAGVPFSVPVLRIIAFTFFAGVLTMTVLLALKITSGWNGWRNCLYAGRTA